MRMILKVYPECYNQAKEAMLFAERVDEVQMARSGQPKIPAKPRIAPRGTPVLVSGRGRANRILNDAFNILEKVTNPLIFILF